ncbi:RING-H2 finger protein ATL47-like isoform X2 [Punica granatum]|uniref:RING-type E3 ubiquitin transferase n=1 Tax=Punica granatum TaxID=22663 RepID=A0A6P8DX07_PUNGR|nr:RING-H2 finger protein ATL47-like isoform X2 [Punica granatum]
MSRAVQFQAKFKRKDGAFGAQIPLPPVLLLSSSSSPPLPYNADYEPPPASSSGSKISPAILFIIIVLAVVFFVSGILHLLIRYLAKQRPASASEPNRYNDMSGSEAFQRQLQQLFHLHDSGLDQAFIDALPVFVYKEIVGLKEPFDCAVCLCEFSGQDKLRGSLYSPGIAFENPVFDFEDREDGGDEEAGVSRDGESGNGNGISSIQKPRENSILNQRRVFSVRLGKFKSSNLSRIDCGTGGGGGETSCCSSSTSSSNLDARRCFSMGSYQYVVSDLELQVALCPNGGSNNGSGSTRSFKGRGRQNEKSIADAEGKRISFASKGESFSISKIWLWSKNKNQTAVPNSSGTQRASDVSVHLGFHLKDRTQNQIT